MVMFAYLLSQFVAYCSLLVIIHSTVVGENYPIDVGGIFALRFTNDSSENRGVLEVLYNGSWGTICNYGFGELEASVACFMMGFEPKGIVLDSRETLKSDLPLILSNFNCAGKVVLPQSHPSIATVHLGVCSFTDVLPKSCVSDKQTAVFCPKPDANKETFSDSHKITLKCPTASSIRLIGGSESDGRVEIRRPDTGEWGTICADGFGLHAARTLCRMLCTSSDNLQSSYPVLYQYPMANSTTPIHLSRLTCPPDATDIGDCDLGDGWGSVFGCTHAMDVGLNCAPSAIQAVRTVSYEPVLECNQTSAILRYSKVHNPDLTSRMIRLTGGTPAGCKFTVSDLDDEIQAVVPLQGCGGSLSLSNESIIAIKINLTRDYLAPPDGIISKLPVRFSVTCLIPRINRIRSGPLVSPDLVSDLIDDSEVMVASLQLFDDPSFTIQKPQPVTTLPGENVNVLVSLSNAQSTSRLILTDCWGTSLPERNSTPKQDLIRNMCAVHEGLQIIPISAGQVRFTFPAFYLGIAGSVVPSYANLFLHCDTRTCDSRESPGTCQQFCSDPYIRHKRSRRVSRNLSKLNVKRYLANGDNTPHTPILVANGDVYLK